MRATHHSARAGRKHAFSPRHNDRGFDLARAKNIDPARTELNIYYNWHDGFYRDSQRAEMLSFEQAEDMYYRRYLLDDYISQQARHREHRNYKRMQSYEDWAARKQHRPEELVLQVGKKGESISNKEFLDCFNDYFDKLWEWNEEHGRPFEILDAALHFDEAVAHAQIRRVWTYDDDGTKRIGQDKALEAAGVALPDPSNPRGRFNNRKMVFDNAMRGIWIETCRAHGLEVVAEPLPDGRHNRDKEQLIADKYQDMLDETAAGNAKLAELNQEIASAEARRAAQKAQQEQDDAEREKRYGEREDALREREKRLHEQAAEQAGLISDGRKYRATNLRAVQTVQQTRGLPHGFEY